MFEIETKELKISDELNRKIEMICWFACVKYDFIPGNIKSIKNTNIACAKPHILKAKGNDYLILEECEEVFINGYNEKIKLKYMIEELSYSFHVGNDKNKTSKAKQISKERSTDFNNNAI